MSETKELNTKDATKHQTEIDILEGNRKMSEDEFDEDEMHLDEELDEYLKLYYNSLRVYDIMKSFVYKSYLPIYDNLFHVDVFELLYPQYESDKYFF